MLIYSTEINFKNVGIQGNLVRLEKPSHSTLNSNNSLKTGQIAVSSQLLAPETYDTKKTGRNLFEKSDVSSNRLNVEEKKMPNLAFSLKYDISNEVYVGEILEGQNKYYDYLMTDRSKLQLESSRNLQISSRMEESILPPLSDGGDFKGNNAKTEDSRLPVYIPESSHRANNLSSKRSNALNESILLKKFEMKRREEDNKVVGDEVLENKEKIDFAQGIRTLQLYGNRMYDIDDLKKEMERSSEEDSKDNEEVNGEKKDENNNQIEKNLANEDEEEDYEDNSSFFKSRKRFTNLIVHANSKRFLPNIKLNITGLVLVISLAIIAIVFEVYNLEGIQNIKNSYKLIRASSQRLFLSQGILNRIFELYLINKGVLTNLPDNYETNVRKKLDETLILLSEYHDYIVFNSFGFSETHTSLMHSKSTNVMFLSGNGSTFSQYFDINDATNQIIGKAYLVQKDNLTNINMENPNVFFIVFNLLNGCYKSAKNSLTLFIGDLVFMIEKSENILVYSIILSVLLLFIGLIVLIYFFIKISQHENHILSIFLEIPIHKAKLLFLKCETFLTQLQQGNEDDDLVESEDMSGNLSSDGNENALDSSNKKNKKRKKVKISYVGLKPFLVKLLFLVGAAEGFFIMKYYFYKTIFENQLSIQSEVNSTLFADAMCGILVNAMRQKLYDPTFKIENLTAATAINIQLQQLGDVFTNLKRVKKKFFVCLFI